MNESLADLGLDAVSQSEFGVQMELMMISVSVARARVQGLEEDSEPPATETQTMKSLVLAMRDTLVEIVPTALLATFRILAILTIVVRKESGVMLPEAFLPTQIH